MPAITEVFRTRTQFTASRALAILLVLAAATIAGLAPLHEVDLAQHLAMGDWIIHHHAVPFVEPFAWTRAGQPFYAYSWLAEIIFYELLNIFGPLGLHVLEAILVGAAVAAAMWAGRQFHWERETCIAFGVLHLAVLWGVGPNVRPQQILFVAIPLAWGIAARIRDRGVSAPRLIALAAVGAIAVNTHLFFPMTAIPIAYYIWLDHRPRSWLVAAAALVFGWMCTPYLFAWPHIFALNFGHNVLLDRPPSILEFVPGFEYARARNGVIIAAIVLMIAPWMSSTAVTRRERAARACFWVFGLLLFAYAGRLVLAWWALAIPLVGGVIDQGRALAASLPTRFTERAVLLGAMVLVFMAAAPPYSPVFWHFEGGTVHRMLPRAGEDPALWLPSWLLCNTRTGAHGRIFTEFNYGSELNWRLPGYSPSIDGRTIFPDSDAVDFSFRPFGRRGRHATTWTHADVALLDRSFWVAPLLDHDTAWVLLAQGRPTSRGGFGALWAKRTWWNAWRSPNALRADSVYPGDPRAVCAATGQFPTPHLFGVR